MMVGVDGVKEDDRLAFGRKGARNDSLGEEVDMVSRDNLMGMRARRGWDC